MSALHSQRWSEHEVWTRRDAWQALAARSRADPLFTSWDWARCWWRAHAQHLASELRVYAFTDADGTLVGLAPFHHHGARHLGVLRSRRLELVGGAWRRDGVVFSEYLDILAAATARDAVVEALAAQLVADDDWDELVLANVREASIAASLARRFGPRVQARRAEQWVGWSAQLSGDFGGFVAGLSSNARRKLFHQRGKLANADYVVVPPSDRPRTFANLSRFLAARWGRAEDAVRAFHEELAGALPEAAVRLTELRSGGRCVSAMFNLRAGDTEYYLQSGFDAAVARGVSPGYLHLGYAIESACHDGIRKFDLLAGSGLHRDYKRDLAPVATPLSTLHLVRAQPLRGLFRLADRLRGRTDITSRE